MEKKDERLDARRPVMDSVKRRPSISRGEFLSLVTRCDTRDRVYTRRRRAVAVAFNAADIKADPVELAYTR